MRLAGVLLLTVGWLHLAAPLARADGAEAGGGTIAVETYELEALLVLDGSAAAGSAPWWSGPADQVAATAAAVATVRDPGVGVGAGELAGDDLGLPAVDALAPRGERRQPILPEPSP